MKNIYKRISAMIIVIAMTIMIMPMSENATVLADSTVWNGESDTTWYVGHESDAIFSINTAEKLAGLASLVNAGNNFSGKTIELTDNIVLNSGTIDASSTTAKTATSISGIKKVVVNNPAVIVVPKTVEVIQTPVEIPSPQLISVKPVGEAFTQSVEVRMKGDPTVKKAIEDSLDTVMKADLKDVTVFPLEISLYIKGTDTKVQPATGTSVVITIPIAENLLANKDKIKVVCLIDGKLTVLDTKTIQIDGVWCVQFSATHFSPYAMVGKHQLQQSQLLLKILIQTKVI